MAKHTVCRVGDVSQGRLTPATIGRSPIVLVRLPSGDIRAFGGRCPHHGAALQFGAVSGKTESDTPNNLRFCRPGEILRCPWHGFEFSLVDGKPLAEASAGSPMQLRFYDVEINGDDVVVVT